MKPSKKGERVWVAVEKATGKTALNVYFRKRPNIVWWQSDQPGFTIRRATLKLDPPTKRGKK